MDADAQRIEWEAPTAIPLTDTESRADRADVWLQNGVEAVLS